MTPKEHRKRTVRTALQDLVAAVEADYAAQGIDPRNPLAAHTWVALALRQADYVLKGNPK